MTALLPTPAEASGPARPSGATPPLRRGVLRRTSTIDVARPEGMGGPRRIDARAWDAVGRDGGWTVLGDAGLEGVVDPEGVLLTVQVSGSDGSEAALVDAVVGPGFRGRAAKAFPHDRADGTLRWTLLDDLPPTMLVSNYARLRAGYQPPWIAEGGHPPKVDICSGWQAKGAMIGMAEREGRQPVTLGPSAPRLDVAGEPDAWHAVEPLPSTGSRRRRRLDVAIDNDDHLLVVDAMFRDTYAQGPDDEIIVHEYGVRARVDRGSLTVVEAVADPHVLPFVECPAAVESADRIVGRRITDLRDEVREEFVGITTCTHLNDLLRSLEDVAALASFA